MRNSQSSGRDKVTDSYNTLTETPRTNPELCVRVGGTFPLDFKERMAFELNLLFIR